MLFFCSILLTRMIKKLFVWLSYNFVACIIELTPFCKTRLINHCPLEGPGRFNQACSLCDFIWSTTKRPQLHVNLPHGVHKWIKESSYEFCSGSAAVTAREGGNSFCKKLSKCLEVRGLIPGPSPPPSPVPPSLPPSELPLPIKGLWKFCKK